MNISKGYEVYALKIYEKKTGRWLYVESINEAGTSAICSEKPTNVLMFTEKCPISFEKYVYVDAVVMDLRVSDVHD